MFAVIDTETTGIAPGSRAVEVAAIIVDDDLKVVDEFATLINPGMPIPNDASQIHGIFSDEVKNAPPTDVALIMLFSKLREHRVSSIIAHNAPYDVGIICYDASRYPGLIIPEVSMIDTLAIARALKVTKKNHLGALMDYYGIAPRNTLHRAATDAYGCLEYLQKIYSPAISPVPLSGNGAIDPPLIPDAIAGIKEIIAKGGEFSFSYTDANGNKSDRTMTPYGVASVNGQIYFHGLCHLRKERRMFSAERVGL